LKHLNLFNKIIFLLNLFAVILLLLSYTIPFLPPSKFAVLSVLSLGVPLLLLLNALFVIYWTISLKSQLFLSLLVLILGISHIKSSFNFNTNYSLNKRSIEIMSYNVHLLNLYDWIKIDSVPIKISNFVKEKSPDILCFQEFQASIAPKFNYPYRYGSITGNKSELVIFSKFKFLNTGTIEFANSSNRAIFTDLIIKSDTVRVYNIHLQSTGINTDMSNLDSNKSEALIRQLKKSFTAQEQQAKLIISHINKSPFKYIISGDFNNTSYSYIYRLLKSNLVDSFEEAGSGFGSTFSFKYYPLRIDFILLNSNFQVNYHKNYKLEYSDHYPISCSFEIQ
jgi:endonuclease/exonuclease/phosphatase family metal-dependent hydrolase